MASNSNASSKSKRPTKSEASQSNDLHNSDGRSSIKGPTGGKRMKKDDSGINIIPESDSSDDSSDCGVKVNSEKEICENPKREISSEPNSPDSGNLESNSLNDLNHLHNEDKNERTADKVETTNQNASGSNSEDPNEVIQDNTTKMDVSKDKRKRTSEDTCSDDDSDDEIGKAEIGKLKYDPTPNVPRPLHRWVASSVVTARQYGLSSNYSPDHFRYNCYGSLHMVERLELMYKMKKHEGCVNALNFNTNGTKLATGSDDLNIVIWDWTIAEPLLVYSSGHRSNVFQAKFMPLCGDSHIASCARDGQVRIGELSSVGICKETRKVAQHKGAAHKLAVQVDSPHVVLSCGVDAAVFGVDLRKEKPEKLVICKDGEEKDPLYSITINPNKSYEYAVGGRTQFVKVYDTRFLNQADGFLKNYCPSHLVNNDIKVNVTSVVYNYNGQEILASYNDEDIYIFDSQETDTNKYLHRYRGHRNSQTVKGVNYFGAKSEYIVSGSDCGYIFFWEKNSEHIVKYMYGDEGGVVNCLEPNPNMPVLATSGLDDDIKIWVPSCEDPPNLSGLRNHLISNMKEREEERRRDCPDAFVDQTIWFLMQHLARARSQRRPVYWSDARSDLADISSSSDSDVQDDDDSEFPQAIQCNQS